MKILETRHLSRNFRDYVLEEMAVMNGCVRRGLFHSLQGVESPQIAEIIYIMYPDDEQAVIAVTRDMLFEKFNASESPFICNTKCLPFRLNALDEQDPPAQCRARFTDLNLVQDLLENNTGAPKNKNILLLISIDADYYQNQYVNATRNLLRKIIIGLDELGKAGNPNAQGAIQIAVFVADTLQAYNDQSLIQCTNVDYPKLLNEIRQKKKDINGNRWVNYAWELFNSLNELTTPGSGVSVNVKFHRWDDILARAVSFDFSPMRNHLVDVYELAESNRERNKLWRTTNAKSNEFQLFAGLLTPNDFSQDGHVPEELAKYQSGKKGTAKHRIVPSSSIAKDLLIAYSNDQQDNEELHLKQQCWAVKRYVLGYVKYLGLPPFDARSFSENSTVCYGQPYFKNRKHYVVPPDLAKQVNQYFQPQGASDATRQLTLHGMGGMGKSSFCINFYENSAYPFKIWIKVVHRDMRNRDILTEYCKIGQALELVPASEIPDKLKLWFAKQSFRSLLIIDDLIDYETLQNYIPSHGCDIIINSRHQPTSQEGLALPMPTLSETQASQLLVNLSPNLSQDPFLDDLLEALKRLPLAIEQAAVYLQRAQTSIKEYLQDFRQTTDVKLLDEKITEISVAEIIIARTFEISITKIASLKGGRAREFLMACSFLAEDNIPKSILCSWMTEYFSDCDDASVSRLIELLAEYSLIIDNGDTISVHAILQSVLRYQIIKPKKYKTMPHEFDLETFFQTMSSCLLNLKFLCSYQNIRFYLPHLELFSDYLNQNSTTVENSIKDLFARLVIAFAKETNNFDSLASHLEKYRGSLTQQHADDLEDIDLQIAIAHLNNNNLTKAEEKIHLLLDSMELTDNEGDETCLLENVLISVIPDGDRKKAHIMIVADVIGLYLQNQYKLRKAAWFFSAANEIADDLNESDLKENIGEYISCKVNFARLLAAIGEVEPAFDLYQTVIKHIDLTKTTIDTAHIYALHAQICQNDIKKIEQARVSYAKALQIYEQLGMDADIKYADLLLRSSFLINGYTNTLERLAILHKAVNILLPLKNWQQLLSCYEQIFSIEMAISQRDNLANEARFLSACQNFIKYHNKLDPNDRKREYFKNNFAYASKIEKILLNCKNEDKAKQIKSIVIEFVQQTPAILQRISTEKMGQLYFTKYLSHTMEVTQAWQGAEQATKMVKKLRQLSNTEERLNAQAESNSKMINLNQRVSPDEALSLIVKMFSDACSTMEDELGEHLDERCADGRTIREHTKHESLISTHIQLICSEFSTSIVDDLNLDIPAHVEIHLNQINQLLSESEKYNESRNKCLRLLIDNLEQSNFNIPIFTIVKAFLKFCLNPNPDKSQFVETLIQLRDKALAQMKLDESIEDSINTPKSTCTSSTQETTNFGEIFSPGFLLKSTKEEKITKKTKQILSKCEIPEYSALSLEKALCKTAIKNYHRSLRHLITYEKININAQDTNPESRQTALHHAVRAKSLICVEILCESGADIHIKDAKGSSPLDYAKNQDQSDIYDKLKSYEKPNLFNDYCLVM